MDKEVVTSADISTLISVSKRLKPGEIVVATLQTEITKLEDGETKIVKNIIKENDGTRSKIINLPSAVPIIGEGIRGAAIIEAFKKSKKKESSFSLKREFFSVIEEIISRANIIKMNFMRAIYKNDEYGRVYIVCNDTRFYLNKEKTHFITSNGNFGEIQFNEDGMVDLSYIDNEDAIYDPNFMNFRYIYVSPEASRRGEESIAQEETQITEELFGQSSYQTSLLFEESDEFTPSSSQKIIDLEAYRKSKEEGPKR